MYVLYFVLVKLPTYVRMRRNPSDRIRYEEWWAVSGGDIELQTE